MAADWRSALSMPADLALAMLAELAGSAGGDAGDARDEGQGLRWRDNADGSRSASFGSIDDLRAAMRAGSVIPGMRFGGKG